MSSFFDKGIKGYRNASNLGEKKLARNIWCKRKKGVTTRLTRTGSVNSDATSLHADPKWPSAVRRSGSSGEGAIDARYRAIPAPLQLPWRPSPDPLLQWESETPETHRQSRRGTEQRSQALSLSPRVFVSLKWERERERIRRVAPLSFLRPRDPSKFIVRVEDFSSVSTTLLAPWSEGTRSSSERRSDSGGGHSSSFQQRINLTRSI